MKAQRCTSTVHLSDDLRSSETTEENTELQSIVKIYLFVINDVLKAAPFIVIAKTFIV